MSDRERGYFEQAVEAVTGKTIYLGWFEGTVVAQAGDGTLEVKLDDERVGSVSKIQLRVGVSDCRVIVAAGTRVEVHFADGSPEKPRAALLDQNSSAARGVARVGDSVNMGAFTLTAGAVQTLTWYPPDGSAPVVIGTVPPPTAVNLTGEISSGSANVLLG